MTSRDQRHTQLFKPDADVRVTLMSTDYGELELRAIAVSITPPGTEPVRGYTPVRLVDGHRRLQAQAVAAAQTLASRTMEVKPLTSPKAVAEARRAALLGKRGRW